jgi:hypothetical protein
LIVYYDWQYLTLFEKQISLKIKKLFLACKSAMVKVYVKQIQYQSKQTQVDRLYRSDISYARRLLAGEWI